MIRGLHLNETPLRILVLYPPYQFNLALHIALCFCGTSADDHFFTMAGKQFLYRSPVRTLTATNVGVKRS